MELWHKDSLVVDRYCRILIPSKLPFGLRRLPEFTQRDLGHWINQRLDPNYGKTVFSELGNKLTEVATNALEDYGGCSVTDLFWVKTKTNGFEWNEIRNFKYPQVAMNDTTIRVLLEEKADSRRVNTESNILAKGIYPY